MKTTNSQEYKLILL